MKQKPDYPMLVLHIQFFLDSLEFILRVLLALRECTVCHEIKKSACSEASCYIDGIKPKGITTATVTSPRGKMKH